jgi:hypothetical protein
MPNAIVHRGGGRARSGDAECRRSARPGRAGTRRKRSQRRVATGGRNHTRADARPVRCQARLGSQLKRRSDRTEADGSCLWCAGGAPDRSATFGDWHRPRVRHHHTLKIHPRRRPMSSNETTLTTAPMSSRSHFSSESRVDGVLRRLPRGHRRLDHRQRDRLRLIATRPRVASTCGHARARRWARLSYTLAALDAAPKLTPNNATALPTSMISERLQPSLAVCRAPNTNGPAAASR